MNQSVLESQIEYFGDGEIMTEKPAECLTYEEIVYNYANLNDYTYIGLFVNQDGKIERLYQVK